jgi:hypothetical protein
MKGIEFPYPTLAANPLDIFEEIVHDKNWAFDRRGDKEMAVQAPGRWCDYSLFIAWNTDMGAMHFTCAFDMRVPAEKRAPVRELLALINEKLWLGHFGVWEDEGLPMFRHALPLRGVQGPSPEQLEDLVDTAIAECERFYPAFQYVIWGGRTPEDAVSAAMVDTLGEA